MMDSLEGAKPDGLNMETTILNSIPCEIDFISLAKKVRVELKTSYADSLEPMYDWPADRADFQAFMTTHHGP